VRLWAGRGMGVVGIIKSAGHALGVEHDRGSHDRTGERAPARLVAAGDRPDAAFDRGALAAKGRADVLLAERQAHDADGCGAGGYGASGCRATHGAVGRGAPAQSTVATLPAVKGGGRKRRKQSELIG